NLLIDSNVNVSQTDPNLYHCLPLQANLPLLQRELLHCARLAKQNPAQYLAQHEQLLLDTCSTTSPVDSSELLLDLNDNGKRRTPDRTKENGFDRDGPLQLETSSKRPCTISPAGQRFSPSNGPLPYQSNGLAHGHPTPPPQHYRMDDMAITHHYRDSPHYRHPNHNHRELRERARPLGMHGARQEEVIDHRLTDREWGEEWKHLDHLLNCIMDMVEKTRRSLTVLRRCQEADREELNYWIRRYSDAEDLKKGGSRTQSRQQSPTGQDNYTTDIHRDLLHRPVTTGYVPEEIWKKAEEAVNEVKRQAMSELQKAVSEAEKKALEMISTERSKMERTVAEAKRQAAEDALTVINQQEDSSESCWNCGRKASETCSGCNTARYCGSFCQHKDWEKHHHVCGQTLQSSPAAQQQQGTETTPSSPAGTPPAAPGTPSTLETTPH
uniref:RUNX1 partner transcriptional co-repressor 1 n=1 Tax=Salmo trutta TaxID=8032 RepID=A0A674A0K1_SALTR